MNILISACLIGINCKYNAGNNQNAFVESLTEKHTLIPVCPEQLGGLPTPRVPSERRGDMVYSKEGKDVTKEYIQGAKEALRIARSTGCLLAILKERSPSCGSGQIYDGTFTKRIRNGDGMTTELLRKSGITVFHEQQAEAIQQWILEKEKEDTNE